mmetsp:Transcript_21511/g.40172  ORF Transcript_21511/g.40172 Transcript_21511/m.40172 type:complete len:209 (+) Transcript_21511:47-673(+)
MMIPSTDHFHTSMMASPHQETKAAVEEEEDRATCLSSSTVSSTSSTPTSHPPHFQRHSQSFPLPAGTTRRSSSIPISGMSSLRRTASETQLSEDEAEADYKDFLFYSRVVNGISKQVQEQSSDFKHENQQCLENIVRARHDMKQQQQHKMLSSMEPQEHHYYYYATANHLHHAHRPQRLVHFANRALAVADAPEEEDAGEEGIFDLEL